MASSAQPWERVRACDLWQSRAGSFALLRLGLVQQVWCEGVKLSQLVKREVPLDLLLVHHSVGQGLFGHLPVVDLFLHGALQMENLRESQQNADIANIPPQERSSWVT